MCAERDPLDCHRGILVCRHLRNEGISIQHIREDGSLEPQRAFEKRLVDRLKIEPDLFDGGQAFDQLVEKAYDLQGKKIAYVQRSPGATDGPSEKQGVKNKAPGGIQKSPRPHPDNRRSLSTFDLSEIPFLHGLRGGLLLASRI